MMIKLRAFTGSFLMWDQVTPHQLDEWLDRRSIGARTRYQYLSILHCFYEWAIDEELCNRDPTRKVRRPKQPPLSARPVGRVDVATVLLATPRGPHRMAIVLMRYAGLRCC